MTTVNKDIAKRGIFIQEFASVVENKSIFAPVATKLVAMAKTIQSPYTSVTAAKAHTQAGRVPVGTLTLAKNELVLDRYIGNSIKDKEEELSYAKFDLIGMIRGDLYKSVLKKLNTQAVVDFVADANVVSGTEDLSTADKVREFLIRVQTTAQADAVGVKQKVDGATVKRGSHHGKAFVACGTDAFVAITAKISSIVAQSSLKGIDGRFVETPYGVLIINLGASADNAKRLIYGTAGALTMGYRKDQIEVDMGEILSTVTYDDGSSGSGSDDLDIDHGDEMIEKTWYMSAQTKGKNGVFSDVQSLVNTRLMA